MVSSPSASGRLSKRILGLSPAVRKKLQYKVTTKDFTPRTNKLAAAGKLDVRRATTLHEPYPTDMATFSWEAIRHAAENKPALQETLQRLVQDDDLQRLVTKYVRSLNFSLVYH
jgi:hypothetical protein